jgi:hypothetical protein
LAGIIRRASPAPPYLAGTMTKHLFAIAVVLAMIWLALKLMMN